MGRFTEKARLIAFMMQTRLLKHLEKAFIKSLLMTNGEPMNLDNYLRVKLMTIASADPRYHGIEWAKAHAAENDNRAWLKWKEAIDQHDHLRAGLGRARELLESAAGIIAWECGQTTTTENIEEWLERNPCAENQSPART